MTENGALLVIPSHMSKGLFDLMAIYQDRVGLCQVKTRSEGAGWSSSMRSALRAAAVELPVFCSVELWRRTGSGEWEVEHFGPWLPADPVQTKGGTG